MKRSRGVRANVFLDGKLHILYSTVQEKRSRYENARAKLDSRSEIDKHLSSNKSPIIQSTPSEASWTGRTYGRKSIRFCVRGIPDGKLGQHCQRSSDSNKLPTLRQTWLQKLSNNARSFPCAQETSSTSSPPASCLPSDEHLMRHFSDGAGASVDIEFVLTTTDVESFLRRAERDHIFRFASTRMDSPSSKEELASHDTPSTE